MGKLTEWFDAEVKPVRKGLYQREWDDDWAMADPDYWDGRRWHINSSDSLSSSRLRWRGLAKEPK